MAGNGEVVVGAIAMRGHEIFCNKCNSASFWAMEFGVGDAIGVNYGELGGGEGMASSMAGSMASRL